MNNKLLTALGYVFMVLGFGVSAGAKIIDDKKTDALIAEKVAEAIANQK